MNREKAKQKVLDRVSNLGYFRQGIAVQITWGEIADALSGFCYDEGIRPQDLTNRIVSDVLGRVQQWFKNPDPSNESVMRVLFEDELPRSLWPTERIAVDQSATEKLGAPVVINVETKQIRTLKGKPGGVGDLYTHNFNYAYNVAKRFNRMFRI